MPTNDIILELTILRDKWLDNASHLDKTIQLIKVNEGLNGVNGHSKTPLPQISIRKPERAATVIKKGAIPNFSSMGINDRIIAIIKHENRFLFRTEIEEIAVQLGKPFKNMIASSLSAIRREGNEGLTLYKIEHNAAVWGYQTWLNEDGSIKPEYAFIPKNEEVMA
jgi:hypothetical protein